MNIIESLNQLGVKFIENESLSRHSSFKIGGPADMAVFPQTAEQFAEIIKLFESVNIRYDVFGKGSNVLFDDNGYRGVAVFTTQMSQISINSDRTIECGAGVSLGALAVFAMQNSISGFEFLYGIPGSVGGGVYMNAGAYDGEISQVFVSCTVCDKSGNIKVLSHDDMKFDYRHSVLHDNEHYILSVIFSGNEGVQSEIKAKMDDLMNRRMSKQPLEYPSAGSTFKRYPGTFTAKLIDDAGLKGVSVGGAQVSEKHAGFVINKNNATCTDVLALIKLIKNRIYEINGIHIECEVVYVPEKKQE